MAIPAAVGGWGGGTVKQTGIKLALYPSTQRGIPIELQQSTGSTLASSQWTSVFLPPSTRGGSLQYTATLPLSTKRYFFRARHTGGGFSAGAFTPTVSARPVVIPDYPPPITVNAAGNVEVPGANFLISSGNAPKVGSQNSTSYLTKQVRFSGALFEPTRSTYSYIRSNVVALTPRGSTETKFFVYNFPLPPGVTLTSVTMAYRRFKNSSTASLSIYKFSSNGATGTPIASLTGTTSTASAYRTIGTTVTQLISTAIGVAGFMTLKTSQATTDKALLAWVRFTYRMPSYDKGI